ncbi:hypothetical protein Q5752_003128 [Cryptotrichosporon argae]
MPRKAWATLVTRPEYVPGLLTLYRTLQSCSSYPLVVLATPTLPAFWRDVIERAGLRIVDVPRLAPPAAVDVAFERFAETWTKLQVFGLAQFDRLVLIDADMLFLRDMDELFDMALPDDWVAAAPACVCNPLKIAHYPKDWVPENCLLNQQDRDTTLHSPASPTNGGPRTTHLLNSGLVVLTPSRALMDRIVAHLAHSPDVLDAAFPDQDTLAIVFHGRWKVLPWWANALKTQRAVHKNVWNDEEVRLLHYILSKPWDARPASLPSRTKHTYPSSLLPLDPPSPTSTVSSVSPTSPTGRPPLPRRLVDAVRATPPQTSLTDYDDLHAWWWLVYEEVLDDLRAQGDESGWREIDGLVAQ